MTTFVPEQFEPIKNIEFDAEQNWFGKTVDKIKVNFNNEEDLQLLLLNIFVHDFGHDYNFLGDSYLRRIVSNIKELDSLGIENENKVLKRLVDIISGDPRVPFMYNDNIFVDVADSEYLSPELKSKKQQFYERLNGFEDRTTKQKQLSEVGKQLDENFLEQQVRAEEVAREKPLTEKEQRKKEEGKLEGGDIVSKDLQLLRAERIPPLVDSAFEPQKNKKAIEDLETGIETGTINETVNKTERGIQDETPDLVIVMPHLSSLKIDISNYVKARANDPESLEMLSTLKLYITSYLGPNYYTSLIPESVDPTSDEFYRYYMHYSVITTFYGLICYYDDIVEEQLVDERMRDLTTLFSDLLLILLTSYLEFTNDAGQDYFSRENAIDPLSILDSVQVMNNYNRLFAEYFQSSESEFKEFKSKLLSEYEIVENTDTEPDKVGGGDDDIPEEGPYLADEDDGSDDDFEIPQVVAAEKPKYKITYVKRQYGVFHNNLLTTVARGIFLKTGVWQKIYPPAQGDKAVDFPTQFNYDKALPKTFLQQFDDWKTGELSLITNITKELLDSRGFKNDLLIAEILILKHMLIEILPDFLYLANGIDDRLRNFLEVYLYKCGNYDADLKPLSEEDLGVIAVASEQEANAEDLKFIVGDDDVEELVYGGSMMTGGVNFGPGTIYDAERKNKSLLVDILPETKKKTPQLSKEDVERAYKLNMDVIRNLTESSIPTITLEDGKVVNNMFELLKMNTGMIKRDGSDFSYPAPKKRFILDNASKLNRNVNGLKLFHGRDALESLEGDADYKELLKKFGMAQKFFGLYKTLKRGVVCAGSSMLDAMDNCSLEKGTTEPKEVGTTNFEFVFDDPATGKHFSYGGVVLFYKGTNKNREENINVHINFSLKTKLGREDPNDVAHVVVDELDVADSEDLKARIVYKSIIKEVNSLFKCAFRFEELKVPPVEEEDSLNPEFKRQMRELAIKKMRALWSFLQFNPYSQTNPIFNRLLGKTGVKNLGDLLQESQGTIKWGGYVNTVDDMDEAVKEFIRIKNIDENDVIYRSVSKREVIIPYDENGDALRLAVEGDRPSAFRAIYFVLFALTNGFKEGINSMTIAGYLQLARSILVSRNEPFIRVEPPPVPPLLVGLDSSEQDSVRSRSSSDEEGNSSRPPSPFAAAEGEVVSPRKEKNLDSLEFSPCPIPYGKVIYVNSEAKNINIKAVEIKDPQIKKPKTLEELEKKLKTVSKSKKSKSAKSSESAPSLTEEEVKTEKFKIKRDLEELVNQINIGSSIPKYSELKDIECSRNASGEEPNNDEPISVAALGVSTGGKTRKHKILKLFKKNTNTRNKNKTKRAKKSKKTIKHRNKVQKRHKKTR